MPDDSSIESLANSLKLIVPLSVKECRRKGESLSKRARNDTISNSLVLLRAAIGKDKPSQSDFELCAQRIIKIVPELKDPLPPVNRSVFKQWVSIAAFECYVHTIFVFKSTDIKQCFLVYSENYHCIYCRESISHGNI